MTPAQRRTNAVRLLAGLRAIGRRSQRKPFLALAESEAAGVGIARRALRSVGYYKIPKDHRGAQWVEAIDKAILSLKPSDKAPRARGSKS